MSDIRVTAKLSGGINATAQIANVVEIPVSPDVYTGDYEKTALLTDVSFETEGKMCTDDINVNLGYDVIRGNIDGFEVEEWVNDQGVTYESQVAHYAPKEYTITDDITLSNAVAYPDGIKMKQGYSGYIGEYTVSAPSEGSLALPTKDKLMMDNVTIEANHEIEDAMIQNTELNEYVNDRVTTIGITGQNDVFSATQIKKISFPNATTCPASYAFHGRNISLLEELYMPKLQTSGYGFAENNPNLRVIDFGFSFGGAKCRNCPNLETIVVRDTGLKNLGSTWLYGCTKMLPSGSGGHVYVPQVLLSRYQANASWQQYAHVLEFRPIEGSEYELEE